MSTIKIEIIRGSEGLAVAINSTRVAGPKPWGGGTIEAAWDVDADRVADAIGDGFQALRMKLGLPPSAPESKPDSPEVAAGTEWAKEYAARSTLDGMDARAFFDARFSACKGDYDRAEALAAYEFAINQTTCGE